MTDDYQQHHMAREKVLHKLTGAAYQMTFEDDYDRAVETMALAINFWGPPEDDSDDDLREEIEDIRAAVNDIQSRVASMDDRTSPYPMSDEDIDALREKMASQRSDIQEEMPESPFTNGETPVDVPGPDTHRREIAAAMLVAHRAGEEWLQPRDLRGYGIENPTPALPALNQSYGFVQWKANPDGRGNIYRVDPDARADVWDALEDDIAEVVAG